MTFSGAELAPGTALVAASNDDINFFTARAEVISPHQIKISTDDDKPIENAWYTWADNPSDTSLRTADGMLLHPFRTSVKKQILFPISVDSSTVIAAKCFLLPPSFLKNDK